MPNLTVYLVEGFAAERKTALLSAMTDVVVASLGAPKSAVRIYLIETPRAHICVGGATLAVEDGAGGPTVHAALIAGRTEAQKSALISGLTQAIEETLGLPADPVRIMIFDVANTDFGMRGVTAKSLGR